METKLFDRRTGHQITTKMNIGNIKSVQDQCELPRYTCKSTACHMMIKNLTAMTIHRIRICDIEIE